MSMQSNKNNSSQESAFSHLITFASDEKSKVFASIFISFLSVLCSMIPYFIITNIIIDIYDKSYTLFSIVLYGIIILITHLSSVWFACLASSFSHKAAFGILKKIRIKISEKMTRMPMGNIINTPSGKLKTLFLDIVEQLETVLAHMIPEISANLFIPLCMFSYMLFLDWRLALISLITLPFGAFCYKQMTRDYEKKYNRVVNAAKNMNACIVEYVNGIEVIKTFSQGKKSYQNYEMAVQENCNAKADWFMDMRAYYSAGMSILPAGLIGVLPLGLYLFEQGSLSAPVFISCIILTLGFVKPIISAIQYTDRLAVMQSTITTISSFLKTKELVRPLEEKTLPHYDIEFKNVTFAYEEENVLDNITFQTISNGINAIVGSSGSGKSSIAKLLANFWDVKSGEITIGGQNIQNLPLSQAMKLISYVSQDNFLFDRSILENIKMGNPHATQEAIEEASKRASCHDFIISLQNGYETLVGEAGAKLSGGERQRITIARAILKDSPIIILDEATAFTDPENEAIIQESLSELVKNKTVILIAHKLGTIINADKIIVLDKGIKEAEGTHITLLEKSPTYKKLWKFYTENTEGEVKI